MSYSRNKYRCLLRPSNQNVIVCNDNNINKLKSPFKPIPHMYPYDGFYSGYEPYRYPRYLPRPFPYVDTMQPIIDPELNPTPKPTPKPNIMYPYYYDGLYPGYGGYPGYRGYFPGYESGYFPGYGRGYGPYSYAKESSEQISPKSTPKPKTSDPKTPEPKMNPHCYYSSDSSDSCDSDSYRRYRYRHHVTPGNLKNLENLEMKLGNSEINQEMNQTNVINQTNEMNQTNEIHIPLEKNKNYSKPFAKLLTKLTTPTSEIIESLGKDEQSQNANEIQNDNEQQIYLK